MGGLDPEARLRLEHAGRWVAWTPDFHDVAASGETFEEVRAAVEASGRKDLIYEWVEPPERFVGGSP